MEQQYEKATGAEIERCTTQAIREAKNKRDYEEDDAREEKLASGLRETGEREGTSSKPNPRGRRWRIR
ncbi:unnamed protein product [Bathycoccus prasinos]